ncbi:hypothetical protein [Dyella sp. EPa41]|uniref:hypothetical protein n=1 Tax=Dyella sp. EPa41 TaxID=1561194 RepID=UPI0019168FAA|nr:hypothetical protein [Dyella sp. EPa41]
MDHRVRALTERQHLLVVDDDAAFGPALAVHLRRMGYISHFALNVKAVHQALARRSYVMGIVDARLAEADSGHLRALLRARRMPVLWLLDADTPAETTDSWMDSTDLRVRKSVGFVELERHVKRALRHPSGGR